MGVFDKTEVSTIPGPINTVTVLRVEEMIALPIKFDNVFHVINAKKSAKKCAACAEFLFCLLNLLLSLFSCFLHHCSRAELANSTATQKNS